MIAENAMEARVSVSFVNERVIIAFASDIQFKERTSVWNGSARVMFQNTVFQQDCQSYTAENGSWKAWRSTFSKSNTVSPAEQLAQWLTVAGEGELIPQTVEASEISGTFPESIGPVYLLVLDQCPVDWNALCDAHIDTLFGGAGLLDTAGDCKVTLLFREENLQLAGVFISAMEGTVALEASVLISPSESSPVVDETLFEGCQESAPLAEEWEILRR